MEILFVGRNMCSAILFSNLLSEKHLIKKSSVVPSSLLWSASRFFSQSAARRSSRTVGPRFIGWGGQQRSAFTRDLFFASSLLLMLRVCVCVDERSSAHTHSLSTLKYSRMQKEWNTAASFLERDPRNGEKAAAATRDRSSVSYGCLIW